MSNSDLRRAWKAQQAKKQDVTNSIPALMGNGHGVIEVPNQPGYVYIRLSDTDLGKAFNNRCPLADNLAIYVGYDPVLDPDRRIFQVLSVRMADYAGAGNDNIYVNVPYHHLTHEFGGGDDVYIEWRRLMGLRVGRPSGFVVTVDDGVLLRAGAWFEVVSQTLDLSAFQPAGLLSCYVLISLNAAGVAIATAGADVAGALDISDCPVPGAGEIPLAAVKLYGTQTAIGDTPSNADIVDLRYPTSASAGVIHLEDLDGYARGHIIRGGAADWESYHAANAGFIVQGNALDVLSAAFDWDTFSAGAGADMVHDHTSNAEGGVLAFGNTNIEYAETNVSNPPTENDVISAFGEAAIAGPNFIGILNDAGAELHTYVCFPTLVGWWIVPLAKTALLAAAMLSILATDTFTDANGTHLNVHVMDAGAGWTESSGSWTISSNTAVQATAGGIQYIATTEASDANVNARVRIKTSAAAGTQSGGVIVRFSDTSNYWMITYITGGTPKVRIHDVQAGVAVERASKVWTAQYQKYVDIDVTCSGNDITATFDGGYTLTFNSAFNNAATKHGITEYRDGTYAANIFEDFQVVDLPTYAWTRQGTVLSATLPAESSTVLEPTVIYDSIPQILTGDKVFKMWYTYGWGATLYIGYAESADGLTWTKYTSNPVVTGFARSSVLKVDGEYWIYGSVSDTQIDLYTSTDGVGFTLDTASTLALGGGGAWDNTRIANVYVWRESLTAWYMLYEACAVDGIYKLGLATSTDGKTWAKSGANPVLVIDGGYIGGPYVRKQDGYYYLWAHRSGSTGLPSRIARYRSANLTTWTPWPMQAEITRVGAGEGENTYIGQVTDPSILEYNGQAYLYFSATADGGNSTGNLHIVLATADARAIRGY